MAEKAALAAEQRAQTADIKAAKAEQAHSEAKALAASMEKEMAALRVSLAQANRKLETLAEKEVECGCALDLCLIVCRRLCLAYKRS